MCGTLFRHPLFNPLCLLVCITYNPHNRNGMRHLWRLILRFGISPGIVPVSALIDGCLTTASQRAERGGVTSAAPFAF